MVLSKQRSQGHYEGFCKSDLWNLFHYILWDQATNGLIEQKNWIDYQFVNHEFARIIAQVYKKGDTVWIHDYHLLLVPQALRKLHPDSSIGFFLHTPFPSSEIFRCLPSMNQMK